MPPLTLKVSSTFLLTLLFILQPCFSKNAEIDSLSQLLTRSIHDTLRAKVLLEITELIYVANLDSAKILTELALDIANANIMKAKGVELKSFQKSKAGALNNIGYFTGLISPVLV